MAQSKQTVQAAQYTPSTLVIECAWCNAEAGEESSSGSTSTICYQHLREMRRIVHERRERIEKMRALFR